MARDPRATVEASLAVARRPTTGQGEREAAIRAADRLIKSHGLDPDTFDIPGRAQPDRPRPRDDLFGGRSDLEDLLRQFETTIDRMGRRRGSGLQAEAIRRERARRVDPAGEETVRALKADAAVSFLWHWGLAVCQGPDDPKFGTRRWKFDGDDRLFSDEGVVEVAQAYGFRGRA